MGLLPRADGQITYGELAAFVDRATDEVRNPLFRPKTFIRAPDGDPNHVFLDLRGLPPSQVRIGGPRDVRFVVRDPDGIPWAGGHTEAGQILTLWLPSRLLGGSIDELSGQKSRPTVSGTRRLPSQDSRPIALSALALGTTGPRARGRNRGDRFWHSGSGPPTSG